MATAASVAMASRRGGMMKDNCKKWHQRLSMCYLCSHTAIKGRRILWIYT